MATSREQIEHPQFMRDKQRPWKYFFKSSKWLKKQMNRFIRRKKIEPDDVGGKRGRKPCKGWEY